MSRISPLLLSATATWIFLIYAAQSQEILPKAAKAADAPGTALPQPSPIHFQVLHSKRVNLGDHLMILNRVVPPVLPPVPPPASPPNPAEVADADASAAVPQKRIVMLFLSASIFDPQVLALQCYADEHEFRFLANMDFNLLVHVGSFETADAVYSLATGVPNASAEEAADFDTLVLGQGVQAGTAAQNPQPAAVRIAYVINEDEPESQPPPEILAALSSLRKFYETNRARLAEDFAKREAARVAREQWLKDNPPKPKDTIINYWIGPLPPQPAGNSSGGQP